MAYSNRILRNRTLSVKRFSNRRFNSLVAINASGGGGGGGNPTYGQSNSKDSGSASSHTITLSGITAGSCLVLPMRVGGVTISSVGDDSGSNTWTAMGGAFPVVDASGNKIYGYYAKNVAAAAGTLTVTINLSGSSTCRVAIVEVLGASTSNPIDQISAGGTGTTSGATQTVSGGTVTTNSANELLIAFFETDNVNIYTVGTNYVERQVIPASPNTKAYLETRALTATGTYDSTTTLETTAAVWAGIVISVQ